MNWIVLIRFINIMNCDENPVLGLFSSALNLQNDYKKQPEIIFVNFTDRLFILVENCPLLKNVPHFKY